MGPSVFKGKAGTDNEVLYRCGDEHLSGFGHGANTSTDVHSYSSKIATADFTLSTVKTTAYLNADPAGFVGDGACASDGPTGTIECGQESIAERLDLSPPESFNLTSNGAVVKIEKIPPGVVSES